MPKVKKVSFKLVTSQDYAELAKSTHLINSISSNIPNNKYAINKFLEDGQRIDEIDGLVDSNIDIKTEKIDLPEKYTLIYISGATKQLNPQVLGAWNIDKWKQLIKQIYQKYKIKYPIVLIGASFDSDVIEDIEKQLKNTGIEVKTYIQYPACQVAYIIKNAEFFIGFQSGLNIIADNFDIKQIMLYYEMLKPMLYTWCKKENIQTKFYAFTFSNTIEEIVNTIPSNFLGNQ